MGQEFFINSQQLEDKIRTLLPSQGGAGAGFDLSASTQIIPVIDVTESAEGSNLREDLQLAQSLSTATVFTVGINTTATLISNTGYFSIKGFVQNNGNSGCAIKITDGVTTKNLYDVGAAATGVVVIPIDIVIFLPAGHSCTTTTAGSTIFNGSTRQIATIDGTLVNPN